MANLTLEWDQVTGAAKYRLYYWATRPYTTTTATFLDEVLHPTITYTTDGTASAYGIRTVDSDGDESLTFSNIFVNPTQPTYPEPPQNLRSRSVVAPNPTPQPDTTPPACSISSPANASTQSGSITVSVTATDNIAVAGVRLLVDGVQVGAEDVVSPYQFSLDTTTLTGTVASPVNHVLQAVARDTSNNTTASSVITISVQNANPADTTAPTCSISAPSAGATVSGAMTFTVSASDAVGVTQVQFFIDGQLVATDTSAPYSISVDTSTLSGTTTSPQNHTLTAKAYDLAGNIGTSVPIVVSVQNTPVSAPSLPSAGIASYPARFIDRTYSLPTGGSTITAVAGDNLQTHFNNARQGDVIVLPAGVTFSGNFTLPNKSGSGWIYVISSSLASLPAAGTRVAGATNVGSQSVFMPKIMSPNALPAIKADWPAHHWRFVGIEIGTTFVGDPNSSSSNGIILIGTNANAAGDAIYPLSTSQEPNNIHFDRCYAHGSDIGNISNAIHFNASYCAFYDGYVDRIRSRGFEAKAFVCHTSTGAICLYNNHVEAAGMGFMIGGAPSVSTTFQPNDIEIRNNHFFKPLSWMTTHATYAGIPWAVKNGIECKDGKRVLIDSNVIENAWVRNQYGHLLVLTVSNDALAGGTIRGPSPWTTLEDVTVQRNIFKGGTAAMQFYAYDNNGETSTRANRVHVRYNLWYDIDPNTYRDVNAPIGDAQQIHTMWIYNGPWPNFRFEHNTVIGQNYRACIAFTGGGQTATTTIIRDNVIYHGAHNLPFQSYNGVIRDGTSGIGGTALTAAIPGGTFSTNGLIGQPISGTANFIPDGGTVYSGAWAGNKFIATVGTAGFANEAGKDYTVTSGLFNNAASDGTDMGCAFTGTFDVNAATAGVTS